MSPQEPRYPTTVGPEYSNISEVKETDLKTTFMNMIEVFKESMRVTLMRTPSNRGYGVSTDHLLSKGKASSRGSRLHSIELLAKGIPWKFPNNPGYTLRQKGLSENCQQGVSRATPIQLMKKSNWCLHEPSPLHSSLFWYMEVFFILPKEKHGHQPGHKTFDLKYVLPIKYVGQNDRSRQPMFDLT